MPAGDEKVWLPVIQNKDKPLDNGWFSVKQPSTVDLERGITWEEARREESEFFELTSPWSTLDHTCQQQLGAANLIERLSSLLSQLIARRSSFPI